MNPVLKELFDGNLRPWEQITCTTPAFYMINEKIGKQMGEWEENPRPSLSF